MHSVTKTIALTVTITEVSIYDLFLDCALKRMNFVFRLCLESAFVHRDCTSKDWNSLPTLLKNWLIQKKKAMELDEIPTAHTTDTRMSRQGTCVVS